MRHPLWCHLPRWLRMKYGSLARSMVSSARRRRRSRRSTASFCGVQAPHASVVRCMVGNGKEAEERRGRHQPGEKKRHDAKGGCKKQKQKAQCDHACTDLRGSLPAAPGLASMLARIHERLRTIVRRGGGETGGGSGQWLTRKRAQTGDGGLLAVLAAIQKLGVGGRRILVPLGE